MAPERGRTGTRDSMHVLLPDQGWTLAKVYSPEDRLLNARYANALGRLSSDPNALQPFRGKSIMTSKDRVMLITDNQTLGILDRKNMLRGKIDSLYA
jgi:hypothetical protein